MAARRELAQRISNGIEVRLLWQPEDDALVVSVLDWNTGAHGEVVVGGRPALEVFEHPFAYGMELGEPGEPGDPGELLAA
jgi:hypothetical protein